MEHEPRVVNGIQIWDLNARNDLVQFPTVSVKAHRAGECWGKNCPLHKPTAHPYVDLEPGIKFSNMHIVRYWKPESKRELYDYIVDPDDFDFNQLGSVILRNAVVCLNCGDLIVSVTRHNYRLCKCASCFVDGGDVYRRCGMAKADAKFVEIPLVVDLSQKHEQLELVEEWEKRVAEIRGNVQ